VGYAGVENPLFVMENNAMYLGDAKESTDKLVHTISMMSSTRVSGHVNNGDIEAPALKEQKEKDDFTTRIPEHLGKTFLKIGVVKEIEPDEVKVALAPEGAKNLLKAGIHVYVESNAGIGGDFADKEYEEVGATILQDAQNVYDIVDVIVKIRSPTLHPITGMHEIDMLPAGKTIISYVGPLTADGKTLMEKAAAAGVNLLAVDAIPRISRAQALDVLSSQAKVAGYRAVIDAAKMSKKFLNGEITAAGSFQPSIVMVIGAGVAGLASISTANNLGAIVRAFDTRLECKEQVESLGGEFLVLDFGGEHGGDTSGYAKVMSDEFYQKEMAMFKEQAKSVDIIITTAAIPGRKAPILLKKEAVDEMKPGSIIVDLAGGNCELTKPGATYSYNGVTIIGGNMMNQEMAWQASMMYSNNMVNLFSVLCKNNKFDLDMNDQIIRGMTCVHENKIIYPPPESVVATSANAKGHDSSMDAAKATPKTSILATRIFDLASVGEFVTLIFAAIFFGIVAAYAPVTFSQQLGYFILAGFLGYYLVWNVEPALFSPLMSTSNALSGVVILGGILMCSIEKGTPAGVFGCIATSVAAINVFGGFAVSYRMLLMFKKEESL
jgi:H+-translocating NAD(P) transhydrogenase subunit alpha